VRAPRRVPAEIRNVSFPVAVWGYERQAVDRHIARVNRLIAELEATRSPDAAIKHALERAKERTSLILRRAREAAEEIAARARQEADEITARAKAEAGDIVVNASAEADRAKADADEHVAKATTEADEYVAKATAAAAEHVAKATTEADEYVAKATAEAEEILAGSRKEAEEQLRRSREEVAAVREKAEAWAREFHADTEAIWGERRGLLDDIRELAARLQTAADNAAARTPSGEPAARGKEGVEPETEDEGEHGDVTAADRKAPARPRRSAS
jgi:cell division septum initiation protein DivIVA